MENFNTQIESIWKTLDPLTKEVADIKDQLYSMSINNIQSEHRLKELIVNAVAEGNKSTDIAIGALNDRVKSIEDAETKRLLKHANEIEDNRKENRRHFVKTFIAVVVTFFVTLILNNFFDILIASMKQ